MRKLPCRPAREFFYQESIDAMRFIRQVQNLPCYEILHYSSQTASPQYLQSCQNTLSSSICSIISSTRQCKILHNLSIVLTCTFSLCRRRLSCERLTLYVVYKAYWEMPLFFMVFHNLSYFIISTPQTQNY